MSQADLCRIEPSSFSNCPFPILSYSVLSNPFWVDPIGSYSNFFGSIRSYFIFFDPKSIQFNNFGSHSFFFGLIRFNSILFDNFYSYWSFSVYNTIRLIQFDPIRSYSIIFGPIRSNLVIFDNFWSNWYSSVLFDPIQSNSILFGPYQFYSIQSDLPQSHSVLFFYLFWSNSIKN